MLRFCPFCVCMCLCFLIFQVISRAHDLSRKQRHKLQHAYNGNSSSHDASNDPERPRPQYSGRKRTVNKRQWKASIRKSQKRHGEQYTNQHGAVRPARQAGSDCGCKRKCLTKLPSERWQAMHDQFWMFSDAEKHAYLQGICSTGPVKRRYSVSPNGKARKFSARWSLSADDSSDRMAVCKNSVKVLFDCQPRLLRSVSEGKPFSDDASTPSRTS